MKFVKNVIITIALILGIIVFLMNLIYIAEVSSEWKEQVTISYFGLSNLIVSTLIAIGIISISNCIDKLVEKEDKKRMKKNIAIIGFIFLIYITIMLLWVHVRQSVPAADSMRVYEGACQMFRGENLTATKYFELYPQNLSLAYIFSKIFWVLNSCEVIIIKVVNVIANCFSVIGLYFILKLLGKEYRISKTLFFILSFTYIPLILLVNFTYGDLVSLPLTIFALYFAMKYVKNKKIRYLVFSAILMMISAMERMNNLIFIIAIAIYLILNILEIKKVDLKNIEKLIQVGIKILCVIMFVIVAIIPSNILKGVLSKKYNLNPEKTFPTTGFFAMGMQEGMRANGWYNESADIGWNQIDTANEQYVEMIKQRITDFSGDIYYTIKFYTKKVISMWAEPLQESIWQNLSLNMDKEEPTEEEIEEATKIDEKMLKHETAAQLYQRALMLIIFGVTVMVIIVNRRNLSNEVILLLLSFVGGFIFHILWEGKSRYIIPYIVVLIPIASIKINSKIKEKKEDEKNISSHTNVL